MTGASPDDLTIEAAPAPGPTGITERCAWSLVWLAVVIGGVGLWGAWTVWAPSAVVAPLLVLIGTGGLVTTWLIGRPRSVSFQAGALAAAVVSVLAGQGSQIHARQYYSTDSAAFTQVAARLLLHGSDPYSATMGAAAGLLQSPANYWTYTVDGGHVSQVSYPAGSFLFEVPALALGFHHEIVDWLDLFAWLVTGVLIFVLLPASVRWLGALVMVTPILAGIFASGGTDAIFLPFLVLAVWRWDRFGLDKPAGLARWVGPVALGIACSIKQTPWFFVPFLVAGVFIEARSTSRRPARVAGRYLAVVVAVFTVVNLPFIVWAPGAWAKGTVLPFSQPLVADGQGLVTLALHGIARGVSLPLLVVAGLLVFVALFGAFVVWYPAMKGIWIMLVPVWFFVAPRSLTTYLVDFFPVAIVGAVTVMPAVRQAAVSRVGRRRTLYRVAVGAAGLAALVLSVLAFVSPPLQLQVRSVATSHGATSLDSVRVAVRNETDGTVTPHFMVTVGSGHPDGFWHASGGRPVVLAPRSSAVVTLYPSNPAAAPTHGSRWLVVAYTSSPEALSASPPQVWRLGKVK